MVTLAIVSFLLLLSAAMNLLLSLWLKDKREAAGKLEEAVTASIKSEIDALNCSIDCAREMQEAITEQGELIGMIAECLPFVPFDVRGRVMSDLGRIIDKAKLRAAASSATKYVAEGGHAMEEGSGHEPCNGSAGDAA